MGRSTISLMPTSLGRPNMNAIVSATAFGFGGVVTPAAKAGIAPAFTSPLIAVAAINPSVSKIPGITKLTLMPSAASSRRKVSNAARSPRLDAAYTPTHDERGDRAGGADEYDIAPACGGNEIRHGVANGG